MCTCTCKLYKGHVSFHNGVRGQDAVFDVHVLGAGIRCRRTG